VSSPLTILVVEDEPSDFELVELAFAKLKAACVIQWVHDGEEARQYLAGECQFKDRSRFPLPGLVIADLNMPRLTGHELLAWLKSQPSLATIPLIVMTSSNHRPDIERAYAAGAAGYFLKPTSFDDLIEVCGHIVGYWTSALPATKSDLSGATASHEVAATRDR
jgi:CheY-like chemotaxis protein